MTREEIESFQGIEQPYCFETDREEDWYKIGCIDGLDAADTDPDTSSLWHDASEEPKGEYEIMILDKFGTTRIIDYMEVKQYYDGSWTCNTREEYIISWAYISVLLPKGGGR